MGRSLTVVVWEAMPSQKWSAVLRKRENVRSFYTPSRLKKKILKMEKESEIYGADRKYHFGYGATVTGHRVPKLRTIHQIKTVKYQYSVPIDYDHCVGHLFW